MSKCERCPLDVCYRYKWVGACESYLREREPRKNQGNIYIEIMEMVKSCQHRVPMKGKHCSSCVSECKIGKGDLDGGSTSSPGNCYACKMNEISRK